MADETRIDPEGLLRLFSNVEGIGVDVKAALGRVDTIRTTLPEPWGTDEYGDKFAAQREPNAKALLEGVNGVVTGINELVAEGRGAVTEFQAVDGDNGQVIVP